MRKRLFPALFLLLCLFILGTLSCFPAEQTATVVIDWTRNDGSINRAIFSTQGFMQVYVCKNPMVLDGFKLLNPKDTQTRLETYIDQMEPENDDTNPYHFNWEKFHPKKMIRFIDDRDAFDKILSEMQIEPLSLLCYLAPWLRSNDPSHPINNIEEWTEFACAVIHSYNVNDNSHRPNLRYVEIWNEPNMEQFYTGTMESYFELFNTTADRIHKDYPGVMVGGPALTNAWHCKPEEWMEAFLKACGTQADFITYHHYGPQGEPVEVLANEIKKWTTKFRSIPAKEQGKVMITETDAWFSGWPKAQYMMERQFCFLDLSDMILGIHHFCCLAYNESGNYTFGIINTQGGVIEGTFWPYWLFRNLIGQKAYFMKQGQAQGDFELIASHTTEAGRWLGNAVFYNKKSYPIQIEAYLYFPPSAKDRVLAFNIISETFKGVDKVLRIPADSDQVLAPITLAPGCGLALTLQDSGKRIFKFRDLNNQETPWIQLNSSKTHLNFGDTCELTVQVLNTGFSPASGKIALKGLPANWTPELIKGTANLNALPFGAQHACRFRIAARSIVQEGMISFYAILETAGKTQAAALDAIPHSIPATINISNPLKTQVLPLPIYAVRGEETHLSLLLTNLLPGNISGKLVFQAPTGCEARDRETSFTLAGHIRSRYSFPFLVKSSASLGPVKGTVTLEYLGTTLSEEFTVEIVEGKRETKARPVDLRTWINFDAVAFSDNRMDYDRGAMGLFVYPGDFTPSDEVVFIRGIPYKFASMEDGNKNAILPQGQVILIPQGAYKAAAFIGFGHDGEHPGNWTFHYTDGTKETVSSQIPEWCTPTPEGFKVAMNAPYRYIEGGPAPPPCQLFSWSLKPDASKTLKAVELPVMKNAYLFAITLIQE